MNQPGKLGWYSRHTTIFSSAATHLQRITSADVHIDIQAFNNDRPVVPGRVIALQQWCVSLLEVVRMWLRQQHDLSGEAVGDERNHWKQLTECERLSE